MIKKIKFKETRPSPFQLNLSKDLKEMKKSKHLYVEADKTTNVYKVSVDKYQQLLSNSISVNYKKTNESTNTSIDKEAKSIAQDLKLEDRVERFAHRQAFITLKDHKENFANNPKCRLINPAKSEIGLISKRLLENIIHEVKLKLEVNQWRQTAEVISWFKAITDKKQCTFIQLDIAEFYPSISEELLENSISFAKQHNEITNQMLEIIRHSRKSLLFDQGSTWVKKINQDFDVTMGSYDGAEVCELVGLFLLSKMKENFKNLNFGLYRDDGLGFTHKLSGPKVERLRKDIISMFKSYDLKIEISCNLHIVDFLDVSFDLRTGKYSPFRKPNNNPLYIHRKSNHPPSVLKQLPIMISERISSISCDANEFNKVKDTYNKCLEDSGFKEKISYKHTSAANRSSKPRRRRNIIWFNPPFNERVKTNIGKAFLSLLDKHFPPEHRYHSIFNRSKVKLSYSCTANMSQMISGHNKQVLESQNNTAPADEKECNCRKSAECPLDGHCLQKCIIYKASVTSSEGVSNYIGSTEDSFKARYTQHKSSFTSENKCSATALSKYLWELKRQGIVHSVDWKVIAKCQPYRCGTRRCNLCLTEKMFILMSKERLLNKNSELLQKCRHSNKYKLGKIT